MSLLKLESRPLAVPMTSFPKGKTVVLSKMFRV